jgi:hypothetical protein
MDMTVYKQIKAFVAQRECAYASIPGSYDMAKRKAVGKLKDRLSFTRYMTPLQQQKYLANCKQELLLILPAEHSRFQQLRSKILNLINEL